jgi:predicted nucleic-acid-binding Zn-ribbon protein
VDKPEYLRTCKKCGYTWKVNGWYSKPRSQPSAGLGGSMSGMAPLTYVPDTRIEKTAEVVAQLRTCDKCGSHDDYTQKRIWHETKADFEGSDED